MSAFRDMPSPDFLLTHGQLATLQRLADERAEVGLKALGKWALSVVRLGDEGTAGYFARLLHASASWTKPGAVGGGDTSEWLLDDGGEIVASHVNI